VAVDVIIGISASIMTFFDETLKILNEPVGFSLTRICMRFSPEWSGYDSVTTDAGRDAEFFSSSCFRLKD
jgi:hypothetical protein